MKNNDFRKAFTTVELSDDKKERMLQEIHRKKKLKKRKQLMAIAAGILVLLTSFLLLQNFLDWGGQDSRQGEEENGDDIVEDESDQEKDEEIVEEDPEDNPEDEEIVDDSSEDEDYITFEIPPHPGGMGDEMYMVDDLSELNAELEKLPYLQGMEVVKLQEAGIDTLPIFINPVTPGMYVPEQLEEFKAILREAAEIMGLEIVEEDDLGVTLENGMRLYVDMNLSIDISIDEHPNEITKETLEGKSVEETLEVYQEYFFPLVADLLSYQEPKRNLNYNIFEENRLRSVMEYVEATDNPIDQFFQSQFNRAEFRYTMRDYTEGDLLEPPRISIPYYHLEPFEVLDEIPLRTLEEIVEERKGREILGQELKLEHIVKAEVFYYTFPTGSYFPPVYRLYVQIENPKEIYELDHEDQMMIVPMEVLAVPSEYEREP